MPTICYTLQSGGTSSSSRSFKVNERDLPQFQSVSSPSFFYCLFFSSIVLLQSQNPNILLLGIKINPGHGTRNWACLSPCLGGAFNLVSVTSTTLLLSIAIAASFMLFTFKCTLSSFSYEQSCWLPQQTCDGFV